MGCMEANIHNKFQGQLRMDMDDAKPAIAIVPYGMRPDRDFAARALSTLDWPLGLPDRLVGGSVGDLAVNDHLVFYPSSSLWLIRLKAIKAQISLMIVEPTAIHRRHMRMARLLHRKFAFVITCNPNLLGAIPNGVFLAYGTSWVPEWEDLALSKTENTSLIASNKQDLAGHKLRHKVAHWAQTHAPHVKLLGRAFEPFEKKADGLAPFRYSIVIENVREPSYFTEKLIDALLCKTVPIYWGSPDIGRFFDINGMIICEGFGDIKEALAKCSDSDYAARLKPLLDNQARAAKYVNLHRRAAESIAERLQISSE